VRTDWYTSEGDARATAAELDFLLPFGPGDKPYSQLFPEEEPDPEDPWFLESVSAGDTTGMTPTFKIKELLVGPSGGELWLPPSGIVQVEFFPNIFTNVVEWRAYVEFELGAKYKFIYWE